MSYNIDTWKTKQIENFRIPMSALQYKEDYIDHPVLDIATGVWTFTGRSEGFKLRGKQDGDWFVVEHITSYGEGSGSMQEYLEETVLAQSTGRLTAVLVWEGGDSITRLTVQDGNVSSEDVEL